MDDIDRAQEQEAYARNEALRVCSCRPKLRPTGYCLNCGDPVAGLALCCNADCRQDYDRRTGAEKRCGAKQLDAEDLATNERNEGPRGGGSREERELDSQAPRRNF